MGGPAILRIHLSVYNSTSSELAAYSGIAEKLERSLEEACKEKGDKTEIELDPSMLADRR